jgi:hypothetical protein
MNAGMSAGMSSRATYLLELFKGKGMSGLAVGMQLQMFETVNGLDLCGECRAKAVQQHPNPLTRLPEQDGERGLIERLLNAKDPDPEMMAVIQQRLNVIRPVG